MDTHAAMHTFAKVVELGSFAAAAQQLDLARSVVSRHISQLEQRYGVRLLNRTTRRVSLTDAGRAFHDRIRPILAEVSELESFATQAAGPRPSGRLRVSAPVYLGIEYLGAMLSAYAQAFPEVAIDLDLNDRMVDVVEEGFDVALRIGNLTDAALISRPLGQHAIVLCAAPDYLAARGTPALPDDLRQHACLHYGGGAPTNDWLFQKDGMLRTVKPAVALRANSADILRRAALDGRGVAYLPGFLLQADLDAGRLLRLLPDYEPPALKLSALYPHRRHGNPKVQSFVDFLQARLQAPAARP
jgi:DNA-binding transcriptional LysR family regulator